jgi:hypothetical protein
MNDDIVARLRLWSDWLEDRCPDTEVKSDLREAADEIERLREELTASHESHGNEVGSLTERLSLAIHERYEAGRKNTEPAALRGTPSDGEASASEGYLHTGASVQTEKADG